MTLRSFKSLKRPQKINLTLSFETHSSFSAVKNEVLVRHGEKLFFSRKLKNKEK